MTTRVQTERTAKNGSGTNSHRGNEAIICESMELKVRFLLPSYYYDFSVTQVDGFYCSFTKRLITAEKAESPHETMILYKHMCSEWLILVQCIPCND